MVLHAEITSLCDHLGISYKDASHRLYMAQWQKLKTDAKTHKAFKTLVGQTEDAIVRIREKFLLLDAEESSSAAAPEAKGDCTAPISQ